MITREQFINAKYPNIPYCEYFKSTSTQFAEHFHVKNKHIQLNFLWLNNNTVSVTKVDLDCKNPWSDHINLFNHEKIGLQDMIDRSFIYLIPNKKVT